MVVSEGGLQVTPVCGGTPGERGGGRREGERKRMEGWEGEKGRGEREEELRGQDGERNKQGGGGRGGSEVRGRKDEKLFFFLWPTSKPNDLQESSIAFWVSR